MEACGGLGRGSREGSIRQRPAHGQPEPVTPPTRLPGLRSDGSSWAFVLGLPASAQVGVVSLAFCNRKEFMTCIWAHWPPDFSPEFLSPQGTHFWPPSSGED